MEVWQKSFELSKDISSLTKELPRFEDYALNSQIRRSATSISANISEAFGRGSNKDKSRFYIMARGSAFETQNHLLYGESVGYFDLKTIQLILEEYDEIIYQLNKIIKSLST